MRHDFATVVQMVVPDEDSAAALVAAVPADSEFLLRRGDEDLALAEPFARLVVRAVEVIASGRNVVVLSTDDLKTLAETEELLDLQTHRVFAWMKSGWLEDYGTAPQHRIPLGAIRHLQAMKAEEQLDLTRRRLPGFDDESAQCRWTSVVELLESARAEGQLLARAFEQGAAVVVRSASGAEEPLPEALQDVLVAAAGAAGGGHAVVLAEVGELVDVRAAAWNLSVSLSSIPSLIERGTLDDFYFEGEHHLPAASVEAYVTLRRAAADRAMAELEAERARRGHEQP